VRGDGGELLRVGAEGQAGPLGEELRAALAEPRGSAEARAHGGAAEGEGEETVARCAQPLEVGVELRAPAADLLSQGEWNGVLEVRAADLQHPGKLALLAGQGVAQRLDGGKQPLLERCGAG
jgi:hypothetical protein